MKIICAPDKFKESMTAAGAAEAMARGIVSVRQDVQIDRCPIADGGDGTVEALLAATGGQEHVTRVSGPLGNPVEAQWGILGRREGDSVTAVIEMAAASGMALLDKARRDPTKTSTFGTGQLMAAALDAGAQRIILGIGGSATNDAGCGAVSALGGRFFDGSGNILAEPITGAMVGQIERIDLSALDRRLESVRIVVACDVTNPLTGPDGAAHIFGPQKGASAAQIDQLDAALGHFSKLVKRQLGKDVQQMPGAGAAGGMGAGTVALLGATLQGGIEMVLDAVGFTRRVAGCDLCLTGEGRLDGQSLSGKACLGVARAAAAAGVPTVALVGALGADAHRTLEAGLRSYHIIGEGLAPEESIRRGAQLLEKCAGRVVQSLG